jgi:hypothetical protein
LDLIKVSRRGEDGSFRRVAGDHGRRRRRAHVALLPGFALSLTDFFAAEL